MARQKSMRLFEQVLDSEATKKAYKYQLNKFKEWAKIKNFDELLQAPQKDIQVLLEDYVIYLKKKVSPNSIPIYFAPIELFYVINDITLNFKKIRKLHRQLIPSLHSQVLHSAQTRKCQLREGSLHLI